MRRKNNNSEARVEKRLVDLVQQHGGLCYKFISPNNPGVPDQIVITPDGKTIFVELKAETGSLQNIQHWQHERLSACNADLRVLRGVEQVKQFVKEVFESDLHTA